MKRFFYFVVLMLLSSSAQAGNSFPFVVGGHRIPHPGVALLSFALMRLRFDSRDLSNAPRAGAGRH